VTAVVPPAAATGFFVGWATIATAYRNTEFGEWLNSDDGYVDELLVRPVIDLPESCRRHWDSSRTQL
jgi:hypothetical protein